MKIYCGGRANGKTMKAIQLSVEKQMPIICWSYEHKKQIKQTAKKMNVKWIIPEPILATEVRKKVIGNRRGLYCGKCGKWQKWITKQEVQIAKFKGYKILGGSNG